MEAINSFIKSQTHIMLEDMQYGMDEFGYPAIFDMWGICPIFRHKMQPITV